MGNERSVKVLNDLPKRHKRIGSFLKKTANQYMEFNHKFYHTKQRGQEKVRELRDTSLGYNELTNQQVTFLCMANCGLEVLPFPEHGYSKLHRTDKPDNFRLDYWILLPKDNILLLIEHKHKMVYVTKQQKRKESNLYCSVHKVRTAWDQNESKLKKLLRNRPALIDLTMNGCFKDLKCFTINLVIVPVFEIYEEPKSTDKPKPIKSPEFCERVSQIRKAIGANSKRDWVAAKTLDNDMQQFVDQWEEKGKQLSARYHGVYFFGRLEEIDIKR